MRVALALLLTGLAAPAVAADGAPTLPAGELRPMVRAFRTADGLPHDAVTRLAQSPDGRLWVGTMGGLASYDGATISVYDGHPVSRLPDASMLGLQARADGGLWVGTDHEGAFLIAEGRAAPLAGLPPGTGARAFVEEPDGSVWVGTGRGLLRIRDTASRLVPAAPGLRVASLWLARDGVLWAGTNFGLQRYDRARDRLDPVPLAGPPSVGATFTEVLHEDGQGRLWVGQGSVLHRYQPAGAVDLPMPWPAAPLAMAAQRERLWVGTTAGLLLIDDLERPTPRDPALPLPRDQASAVLVDREDNLWVGFSWAGLHRVSWRALDGVGLPAQVGPRQLRSVAVAADGALLVGTDGSGLLRLGAEGWRGLGRKAGLMPPSVTALASTGPGASWVGTPDGIFRLRGRELEPVPALKTYGARCLLPLPGDGVLVGTRGEGLVVWDGSRARRLGASEGLPDPNVWALARDRSGRYWVGTNKGLVAWTGDRLVAAAPQVAHARVRALLADSDGTLWVGTNGQGLLRVSDDGVFTFDETYGLLDARIYGLALDAAGDLWGTTPRAVFRARRQDLSAVARGKSLFAPLVSFATDQDGTAFSDVGLGAPTIAPLPDGRLAFAGLSALSILDPRRVRPNATAPIALIEGVLVDGEPARAERGELALPLGRGLLEIRYLAPSLTDPRRTRYWYRLDGPGRSAGWTYAGNDRVARFPRIAPGSYRFQLVAANNDGTPSQTIVLPVRLEPPFHRTAWFPALLAAVAGASLLGAHRLRVRQLSRQHEAVLKERTRVARELHDSLLQGITSVALQLDGAAAHLRQDSQRGRAGVERARDGLERALAEARAFVKDLRPGPTGQDLRQALQSVARRLSRESGARVVTTTEGTAVELPHTVQEQLFGVAREAITNALRHAAAKAIVVTLVYGRTSVRLLVQDDGRGFDPTSVPSGHFGLLGMRERAAEIGASLTVEAAAAQGTRVVIEWPRP